MIFVWMFLLPLVILFILLLGAGLTFVRALLRFLGFSSGASFRKANGHASPRQSEQSSASYSSAPSNQRKIIGDDEGEYVDYEEVKE